METFTPAKPLMENPGFEKQRAKNLADFAYVKVEGPIAKVVNKMNVFPHCFTLQSCYGHFLYQGQQDEKNLDPLPNGFDIQEVDYRIAYIAFCIENSNAGQSLMRSLKRVTELDPENIQFCSADWFWQRQMNSYALQIEPDRFKHQDRAVLGFQEALYIEQLRTRFFEKLEELL